MREDLPKEVALRSARDTDWDRRMRHYPKKMSSCFKEPQIARKRVKEKVHDPCSPSPQPQVRFEQGDFMNFDKVTVLQGMLLGRDTLPGQGLRPPQLDCPAVQALGEVLFLAGRTLHGAGGLPVRVGW